MWGKRELYWDNHALIAPLGKGRKVRFIYADIIEKIKETRRNGFCGTIPKVVESSARP